MMLIWHWLSLEICREYALMGLSIMMCNTHLKQIAKACGINKEIGFHLSRHSFATTVYLCNGGTIEALSKILGHKHISTTQIYAEVTNRMVSSDFRAISGNLAAMQRSVLEKKDRKQDGKRVRPTSFKDDVPAVSY